MSFQHLRSHTLLHKRIFLRADLNVPLSSDGIILNDYRLVSLKPTLDYLISQDTRIVLATHIGRPHGVDEKKSTKHLLLWFKEQGYSIVWSETIEDAYNKSLEQNPRTIVLMENLRFYKEEYGPDDLFAFKLSKLGDFYVNDAFSLLHRDDASIISLPAFYTASEKSVGFLVERELEVLENFNQPQHPFVLILGGGKVKDKLPYCEPLLDKVDTLIILPAIACTFLKALGQEVGLSLVEESLLDLSRTILSKAAKKGVKIVLPLDYLSALETVDGERVTLPSIPSNGIALAVGPLSLDLYKKELSEARMIVCNGAMGIKEYPDSMEPFYRLLNIIALSPAYTVVGGGDSVAAVYQNSLENQFSYCSTGGGTFLYYIAHGTLPALGHTFTH
ncbi:phosphoglycerate kinase [Candidatus Dependentiae bacterium]|nr:phosphoglycerate kinase [Candidatus Dependentiae bacterium]